MRLFKRLAERMIDDDRIVKAMEKAAEVSGVPFLDILFLVLLHIGDVLPLLSNPAGLFKFIIDLLTKKQEIPK